MAPEKADVLWGIQINGFSKREDARNIARLLRSAAADNAPPGDNIRIEIHGYTDPSSEE